MKKYGALLVLVLVAAIALTACGAGGNSPSATLPAATLAPKTATVPPTAQPTVPAGPPVTINVELSDSALAPNSMTVPLGAQVTFTVKSTRTDVRDCIFRDLTTIKLYPGQAQWALTEIAAGSTKSLAFTAPLKPASYQIDCGLTGYSGSPRQPAAGLVGTLDVK